MTVGELVQALTQYNPTTRIVLSIGTSEAETFTIEHDPDDDTVIVFEAD